MLTSCSLACSYWALVIAEYPLPLTKRLSSQVIEPIYIYYSAQLLIYRSFHTEWTSAVRTPKIQVPFSFWHPYKQLVSKVLPYLKRSEIHS